MGVHVDHELANSREGVYTYRAQGSIYHQIGSLLPESRERPRDNPYVGVLRQVSERVHVENIGLVIRDHPTESHRYNRPTTSQVAAILVGAEDPDEVNERDIVVQRTTGVFENIRDTTSYYDPLQYPLLLPYGSSGWDLEMFRSNQNRISCREFFSYLLQIREDDPMILLRGGRLLQQYVVDNYVKISTHKLRWMRNNQQTIRAELYQGLQDSLNSGEQRSGNVGRKTILPPSYVGSPRDMHRRYHDAMAIVQKYGKPDLFITMTCNSYWDEITRKLLPGQVPSDRPDLTTRIFRAKCEELKNDLFFKGVLGKVVANVHVIEFQKRGLPHAHILIILNENDKLTTPDDYDKIVRAEIPDPNIEPTLHDVVVKHMIHGPCGDVNPRNVCMWNRRCKKNYPKKFATETLQGRDSYPIYRRRENGAFAILQNHGRQFRVDNRWVIPYNPWLLMKYKCHINVEVCSSIKSVKYLYKYVYKGSDAISMEVRSRNQEEHDEIKQFVDGRWICPQEAMWRIFEFPLNRMYPSVYSLQVHLPNMHNVSFRSNQPIEEVLDDERSSCTMLTEFFTMNTNDEEARQYLYREYPEHYTWDNDKKEWHRRRNNNRVIGRLYAASPLEGERYFLRILLNHRHGPISFRDLRTVNSITYDTFKEAADAMGLLQRDNSIQQCLLEASRVHMPSTLRQLFVIHLVYNNPIGVRQLWNEFLNFMTEDYASTSSETTYVIDHLLFDLNKLLGKHGKKIGDYDLPSISNAHFDYEHGSDLIHQELSLQVSTKDLESIQKLNGDQMQAFTKITHSVREREKIIYFVDGPGGTGKTFLYKAILAKLRSEGHIAIATATSGIAAIMMPGGRTAHSRFKVPIPIMSTSNCRISKQSDLANLLRRATILLWDEATMTHRYAFEALDRTLRDITDVDAPFGGKVFVMGGDFRQVLPVVSHGTRAQTINACVTNSLLWEDARIIRLTENMRARNDPIFADFLLRIGDGVEPVVDEDKIRLQMK